MWGGWKSTVKKRRWLKDCGEARRNRRSSLCCVVNVKQPGFLKRILREISQQDYFSDSRSQSQIGNSEQSLVSGIGDGTGERVSTAIPFSSVGVGFRSCYLRLKGLSEHSSRRRTLRVQNGFRALRNRQRMRTFSERCAVTMCWKHVSGNYFWIIAMQWREENEIFISAVWVLKTSIEIYYAERCGYEKEERRNCISTKVSTRNNGE